MANPEVAIAKFLSGEPLARQEVEEATLYVLTRQLTELEHLCNRLGLLLQAQGVTVAVNDSEEPSPNGDGEPQADS